AAMLASYLREQEPASANRAIMPPAFVVVFCALILLGGPSAMFVAAAATLTPGFVTGRVSRRQSLVDTGITIVAVESADLAHQSMVRLIPNVFVWPWLALPIVAAVAAYHVGQGARANLVAPFVAALPAHRSWARRPLAGVPTYLLGAGAAAAIAAVIDRGLWDVAPVAAAALFFAHSIYADYVHRLEEAHRRREVIDYLEQGMSVLDHEGRVTLWNDARERMLRCSRGHALGQPLTDILPALARTELPRAIADTLEDRQGRVLNHLRLPSGAAMRIVQVKVLPVDAGVSLLWQDVTERARAEHEIKQRGERLALAAEGANDGLWQWNLQTKEFYVSGRWRAMIGLPAHAAIGGPGEWLDRVHPDDISTLKAALDAHLAGTSQVFHHEHRIRHEDGTYRRFLCRGLAVRGAGRKPDRIAGSLTDTTEQAIAQEKLRSVGLQDSLTGTLNRAAFVEGLGRRLDACRRP